MADWFNDMQDVTWDLLGDGVNPPATVSSLLTNIGLAAAVAKGDLLVATGAGQFAILTAGANDAALVADSGEATGLRWATAGTIAYVPSGTVIDFAGTVAPTGYLTCDGSVVAQATYPDLYTAIGTTWNTGGEGAGNFRLPSLSRRVGVGSGGSGTGTLGNAVGNIGGAETHTLTEAELAAHTHSFSATTSSNGAHTHTYVNVDGAGSTEYTVVGGTNKGTSSTSSDGAHTHTVSGTSGSTGSGTAHSILQPSAVVLKCIKT